MRCTMRFLLGIVKYLFLVMGYQIDYHSEKNLFCIKAVTPSS